METTLSCSLCWLTMEQKLKTEGPKWKIIISEYLKKCAKYLFEDGNELFTDDVDSVGCDFCFDSVKKLNSLIVQLEKLQREVIQFADKFSNTIKNGKKLATKNNTKIRVKQETDIANSSKKLQSNEEMLSNTFEEDGISHEAFIKPENTTGESLETVNVADDNEYSSLDVPGKKSEGKSIKSVSTNVEKKEFSSGIQTSKELRVDVKRMEFNNKKRLPNLNKEQFYCVKCDRKFFRKRTFQIHNRIHETKKNVAKCDICKQSFEDLWRLEHHKRSVHQTERPFQCSFCPKSFKSPADLKLHEKPHQTGRCHICSVCDASFRWSKNLKIHRWSVHSIMEVKESRPKSRRYPSRKDSDGINKKDGSMKPKNRKRHHCDLCDKDVRSIGEHMKLHERRYSCPHCEKRFSQKQNLATHTILYHTDDAPLIKCGECDQTFKLQSQLKYHQAVHLSIDKQIVCDECGKTFKRKSDYENHCKARHGKSRLKCERCERTFPLQTLLNQHVKIVHTKELQFVCDVCGKQLSEKRKLKEHMRIHTGEKPYNCTVCAKAYMTTTALGLHRRHSHPQSST